MASNLELLGSEYVFKIVAHFLIQVMRKQPDGADEKRHGDDGDPGLQVESMQNVGRSRHGWLSKHG